jgi:hypothetical protein
MFLYSTVSTLKPIHKGLDDLKYAYYMNIFTNSRNCSYNFTQLELIQDGSLTGGIKTDHKDTHLSLAEEVIE